jgi:hypothetical protein
MSGGKAPPKRKNKRRKHFADYVVGVSLAAVLTYTAAAFTLQFVGGMEISPQLTICFFAFFGTELASLAAIKRGKIKKEAEAETNGHTHTGD